MVYVYLFDFCNGMLLYCYLCFVDDDIESRRIVYDVGWGFWDRGSLEVI